MAMHSYCYEINSLNIDVGNICATCDIKCDPNSYNLSM